LDAFDYLDGYVDAHEDDARDPATPFRCIAKDTSLQTTVRGDWVIYSTESKRVALGIDQLAKSVTPISSMSANADGYEVRIPRAALPFFRGYTGDPSH
jgi:hypothetical protein